MKYELRKVPEVTILFWIIKLLTTGMGETTSDYFVKSFNPYVVVLLSALIFFIILALQFKMKKYIPLVYWLCVVMVAVFGTMAADVLHIGFNIPYLVSSIFFGISLLIIFVLWYHVEHTLSIHSITNRRREVFYWLTVVTTFALGTAVGDMSATTFGLGYLTSGIVFAILIFLPLIGYRILQWDEVGMFWIAYILTRPLGASFADWFGRPKNLNGLGFGTGTISLVLGIIIMLCVAYMYKSKKVIFNVNQK